jgi:hypothetical protein
MTSYTLQNKRTKFFCRVIRVRRKIDRPSRRVISTTTRTHNKNTMGRYAHFNHSSGRYEYKFWFGIQDSIIPWAKETQEVYVQEYDEEEATKKNLTEAQKDIWRELSETELPLWDGDSGTEYPPEKQKIIDEFAWPSNIAEDDDSNLNCYWVETNNLIVENNLPPFKFDIDKNVEEQIDEYVDEYLDKINDHEIAADIHIKLVICCILQKSGSYRCYYEC